MSGLFRRAIELERRTDNATKTGELLELEGKGHPPWPDPVVEAAFSEADAAIEMAIGVGAPIGPGPSDLIGLQWSRYDGEAITDTPSKPLRQKREIWRPLLQPMIDVFDRVLDERRRR